MPSLLGPTNIPPLEAVAMGTRTIVSDAHDSDFVASAALCVVPALDSVAWAVAISQQLKTPPPEPRVRESRERAFAVHEEVFRRMAAEIECWFPFK
jgi:glycosyltransferase involved in cell wall biosynthesis